MFAFQMDLETAEEFFTRCEARHAVTQEERTAILVELTQEGRMQRVIETKRSVEQYVKDTAKNFKVLHVSPKKDDPNEPAN